VIADGYCDVATRLAVTMLRDTRHLLAATDHAVHRVSKKLCKIVLP